MAAVRRFNRHRIQELRDAIRKVLVEVWDPLRLMDDPDWPRDEYDRYIDGVFTLLVESGNDQQIFDHLDWAAGCMGIDGSSASMQQVVAALRKIDLPAQSPPTSA